MHISKRSGEKIKISSNQVVVKRMVGEAIGWGERYVCEDDANVE